MRRQEEFLIDKHEGLASRQFLANALRTYKPSILSQMGETFKRMAFDYNTIKFGADTIQSSLAEDKTIPFEMWNKENNSYFREGVKWHKEFTETDARILAERYDRDREWEMKMGNTDPFSLHNIGAALGAAVFDPLSYIPFVGPVSKVASATRTAVGLARIGKHTADIGSTISMQGIMGGGSFAVQRVAETSRLAKFINPIRSITKTTLKPLTPIAKYSMEGVMAESSYQIIRNMSDVRKDEDIDYMGGVFDVMIAGLFGGILGTLPMAKQFRDNFKKEQLHTALAKATDDLSTKGHVELDGIPPGAEPVLSSQDASINLKNQMDELDNTMAHKEDPDAKNAILRTLETHGATATEEVKTFIRTAINSYKRCSS